MPPALRALRGAITVDEDEESHVHERVITLLETLCARNGVDHDDIVSILFTATDDLHATFPATGARTMGLGDVPLICAQEIGVTGSMARVVRVMAHVECELPRAQVTHVYLRGAEALRGDLPK